MNLLDALAQSLAPELEQAQAKKLLRADSAATRPVLQLSRLPRTLDVARYRDAHSDSNPDGGWPPLLEFRKLVDPLPSFARDYYASLLGLEKTYGLIIEGAAASASNAFVRSVLSEAKAQFAKDPPLPVYDGTNDVWRPVYAQPEDWYEASAPGRFRDLEIDLEAEPGAASPFATIGTGGPLQLSAGVAPASGSGSRIHAVRMKYLLVELRRSWLNTMILGLDDWHVGSQSAGFCSSGRLDENPGVLPLIPTGLLLAKDVEVDADWSRDDQALLDRARAGREQATLGPFSMHAPETLQIVGWISSLVPYSPRANGLAPGWITLKNKGAFVARFSLAWRVGGQDEARTTANIRWLASATIDVPVDAREIALKIEIMTAPYPFETWRVVAQHAFPTPVQKTYEVARQTWDATVTELPS